MSRCRQRRQLGFHNVQHAADRIGHRGRESSIIQLGQLRQVRRGLAAELEAAVIGREVLLLLVVVLIGVTMLFAEHGWDGVVVARLKANQFIHAVGSRELSQHGEVEVQRRREEHTGGLQKLSPSGPVL